MRLTIITGGGSRHSASALLAEQITEAVQNRALAQLGEKFSVVTYHLGTMALDLADYLSQDMELTGELSRLLDDTRTSDAIITVTPVFKASYSGLYKLFWDITEDGDLTGTPLILAAVGGTSRHSLMLDYAMRPLFGYLGASTCATGIYATPESSASKRVGERIERAATELVESVLRSGRTS